jgi:anti-sigma B factor antagonist
MLTMTSGGAESESLAVITVEGKLVLGAVVNSLREQLDKLLQTSAQHIVIDLSRVSYIDSAGIGALALAFFNAKNSGRSLKLASLQPKVMEAIGMTRLDMVIPIVASAPKPQPNI